MQKYGTSYYRATLFFPEHIKLEVFELYKFVRIPDLIVDQAQITDEESQHQLQLLKHHRETVLSENNYWDSLFWSMAKIVNKHKIPFELTLEFFKAMLQDTTKKRYSNYEELKEYMYGSAEVVWLMMLWIFDSLKEECISPARALGEAMQLTNFLRDIREDYLELGRIYMPEEELKIFGCTHETIIQLSNGSKTTPNFKNFMEYMIAKADSLYWHARKGIKLLPKFAQKPVTLSADLYQGILRKIERNKFDVFNKSAKTTPLRKLLIISWFVRKSL